MFHQIPEVGFFEKNHFSHFLEPKKSIFLVFGGVNEFFWTPIPFLASKFMVLGVILLITPDVSFGFGCYFLAKQAIKIISNQQFPEV